MDSFLLNNRAGIETRFHWHHDGTYTIETVQDVEPILELNKRKANEIGKNTRGRFYHQAASIPLTVQYEWVKRYGIMNVFDEEYWPLVRRLLNDSEWRYLRTSEIIL